MKDFYIACPERSTTGGPTLSHQLCHCANNLGFNAKIMYYGRNSKLGLRYFPEKRYKDLNFQHVTRMKDKTSNILIVPETNTLMLRKYKMAIRVIWWMSLDNFYYGISNTFDRIMKHLGLYRYSNEKVERLLKKQKYQVYKENNVYHFVQSYYAKEFLLSKGIQSNKILNLSDYIEDEILRRHCEEENKFKKNIILYNPKKGYEFTKKIINAVDDIEFFPLVNMTKDEMIEKMETSKIYIDFGNHPGKDRIPREACICGCCVVTGKRGSAKNNYDVMIPQKYKFEASESSIQDIANCLRELAKNYTDRRKDFDLYRQKILLERVQFEKETMDAFQFFEKL